MNIIQNGGLIARPLVVTDRPFLYKWLNDPFVLEFYEGRNRPHTMADIDENFYDNSEETRCIVEYDGVPIGYAQFYVVDEHERRIYGYEDMQETIYGMDQFIGEPDHWNRGIGTLLVTSVVQYLATKCDADRIVMDPQCRNALAIACYKKCGFKKVRILPRHEMHEGEMRDCQLVEWVKADQTAADKRQSGLSNETLSDERFDICHDLCYNQARIKQSGLP